MDAKGNDDIGLESMINDANFFVDVRVVTTTPSVYPTESYQCLISGLSELCRPDAQRFPGAAGGADGPGRKCTHGACAGKYCSMLGGFSSKEKMRNMAIEDMHCCLGTNKWWG